jgi:hypothetical protein
MILIRTLRDGFPQQDETSDRCRSGFEAIRRRAEGESQMTIELELGDRVRLSELGISRSPRTRIRTGVVVALPKPGGSSIIGVLFDGNKRSTSLHRSYVEPDDDRAKEK